MKSLKQTNLMTFLTAARSNRPNEQHVPVPKHVADSFLTELPSVEQDNEQTIGKLVDSVAELTNQLAAEKAKTTELKLKLAAQ